MAAEPFSSPIEIDLGSNPGLVRFKDLGDIEAWRNDEQSAWEPLFDLLRSERRNSKVLSEMQQLPIRQLNEILNRANTAHQQGRSVEESVRSELKDVLSAYLPAASGRPRALHSGSVAGQRIIAAAKAKDLSAEGGLAYEIGAPIKVPEHGGPTLDLARFVTGVIDARLVAVGVQSSVEHERQRLDRMIKAWELELAGHRAAHEAAEETIAQTVERVEAFRGQAEASFVNDQARHTETMKRISDTFVREMQLRAPVQYWKSKRVWHLVAAIVSGIAFVVLAAGLVVALEKLGRPVVEEMLERPTVIPTGMLLLVGVPVFAALWILKAVSRLFHVNVAGVTDAGERAVMVQTFLALAEKGEFDQAERILILQALFRPSSGHGSQDDAPPPNWFDLLMDRVRSK